MITLRVNLKALDAVLKLAASVEDRSQDEDIAIVHVASRAAQGCQEEMERQAEIEITGAPI